MTYKAKPLPYIGPGTGSCFRDFCIRVTSTRQFELFILLCILINTVAISLKWFFQPEEMTEAILIVNYTFNAIFTLEAVVKIVAARARYFRVHWNVFDFSIVVLTNLFLVMQI